MRAIVGPGLLRRFTACDSPREAYFRGREPVTVTVTAHGPRPTKGTDRKQPHGQTTSKRAPPTRYVPIEDIVAAQGLVDRICAMVSKLVRSAQVQSRWS